MIPWLLVAELMSRQGKKLSELVGVRMAAYPCSGEINYTVSDAKAVLAAVQAHFSEQNPKVDTTDGLSLEFADWRMNVRASNTEPLLRLNVESRGISVLVKEQLDVVAEII
jgi:phosphomannomutase/phosphomannomutase/phosphoglucomutase